MIRLKISVYIIAGLAGVAGCGGGSSSSTTPAKLVFSNSTTLKGNAIDTAAGDLLGGAVQKGPFAAKQLNYSTVTAPVFRHVTSAFSGPIAVATDGTNQYVTNFLSHTIVKIDPSGAVTQFAGTGFAGFTNHTTTARTALFNNPTAITTDGTGTTFYVADTGNHTIMKIDAAGLVTLLAGVGGSAGSDDTDTSLSVVARFNQPTGLTVIGGLVYVVDSNNHTIRMIDTTAGNKVTTLAGSPGVAGSTDGVDRINARFSSPTNIATDGRNLYVADFGNRTVRRISLADGKVDTIAGRAGVPGTDDGPLGTSLFNQPNGITTDGINLYVTDNLAGTVRRIELSGNFTTTTIRSGLSTPIGLTTNGSGLFVAARNANTIVRIK